MIGERDSSTAVVLLLLLLWCKFEIPLDFSNATKGFTCWRR